MYIYIIQKINNNIRSLGIILKLGEKKERICINLLITYNTYIPFTRSYQFWTHCAQFTRYSELACLKAAFDSQLYEQFDIADQIDLFSPKPPLRLRIANLAQMCQIVHSNQFLLVW